LAALIATAIRLSGKHFFAISAGVCKCAFTPARFAVADSVPVTPNEKLLIVAEERMALLAVKRPIELRKTTGFRSRVLGIVFLP
jgi:hypothetical protein